MAETFDTALRDYHDHLTEGDEMEATEARNKAQTEYELLEPFALWLEAKGIDYAIPSKSESEGCAWIDTADDDYITVSNGGEVTSKSAASLVALLWLMYERETSKK